MYNLSQELTERGEPGQTCPAKASSSIILLRSGHDIPPTGAKIEKNRTLSSGFIKMELSS